MCPRLIRWNQTSLPYMKSSMFFGLVGAADMDRHNMSVLPMMRSEP